MLIRLPSSLHRDLRARAVACGLDPSEVARRALRRERATPCNSVPDCQRVTRADSIPVRLDLGPVAHGMTARAIRVALAGQLAATAARVTWEVSRYAMADSEAESS